MWIQKKQCKEIAQVKALYGKRKPWCVSTGPEGYNESQIWDNHSILSIKGIGAKVAKQFKDKKKIEKISLIK